MFFCLIDYDVKMNIAESTRYPVKRGFFTVAQKNPVKRG
jgi:hypothetical protein